MKTSGSKKGSALLIVLGMLSFMVISAVAFSAYMRTSRLPSSYLRRGVASRMLAKAAMAEAIDEIDAAVGNFPHPGVWMKQNADGTGLSSSENVQYKLTRTTAHVKAGHNANAWIGRVYIGGSNDVGSVQERVAQIPQHETVPTLSLEALAYIPPPLVNEARYYSRHSNAGKWHMMPFDAGRYAFCAIDVSDYFDINALTADEKRSSASRDRISLSYLFESADHASAGSGADQWDSFIASVLNSKVPLVSMADWNLWLGGKTYGAVKSYFYQYVTSGNGSFYGGEGSSDESAEKIRRMSFVSDGWFPPEPTAANADELDLADPANQPFTVGDLKNKSLTFHDVANKSSEGADKLREHIPMFSLAMLYDYLDEDCVPLSLAMPSVERVPMICGLEPQPTGSSVQLKKWLNGSEGENASDEYPDGEKPEATTRRARRTIMFCIDPDALFGGMPGVNALVTYPFRHKDDRNETFTIDGGLAFFFTTDQMGLRPRNAVSGLRFVDDAKFNAATVADNSVILLPFNSSSVTFQQVDNANDAVKAVTLMADPAGVAASLKTDSYAVLKVVYEWTQTDTTDRSQGGSWLTVDKENPTDDDIVEAFCNLKPLLANGTVDSAFSRTGAELVSAIAGKKMQLNVAVYARIKNNAGKTVDLVPASVENDSLNGSSNNEDPQSQVLLTDWCGVPTPLMRFNTGGSESPDTGAGFECSIGGMTAASTSPQAVTLYPGAAMVGDPRYNYAPESWFRIETPNIDAGAWLRDNGAAGEPSNFANRRDGDIFMASSDQNYLQSVYELAHLPRIVNNGFLKIAGVGAGVGVQGDLQSPNAFPGTTFVDKDNNDLVNRQLMWRTYDPFMRYENAGDTFEDLNIVNSGVGFKINPYTDSTNVMMAAFANTPHDWRCASTNEQTNASITQMNAVQFNREHAWNEYSSGAKIAWKDLENVAKVFMEELRTTGGTLLVDKAGADKWTTKDGYNWKWEKVWCDMLPWWSDSRSGEEASKFFLDEQLSDGNRLYNTDKKFLYGYWHDCFAVKQQLFLVFVRAEPLLMGGGAVHQQPPQLGSRAVALVWRDPKNCYVDTSPAQPHRTRILFYRQFD